MKMWIVKYIFLCILLKKVLAGPQITKLFPIQEVETFHQQIDVKPFDKFLGKLRASYNFIFPKPENASNVERILKSEATVDVNNDVEETSSVSTTTEDWWSFDDFDDKKKTPKDSTDQVELLDGYDGPDEITPEPPSVLHQQLLQWLSSLLGVTYGIYAKFLAFVCN